MKLKKIFKLNLLFKIFLFCFLIFKPKLIVAQEIKTDYEINYLFKKIDNKFKADVSYKIFITNLRSDIYVSRFLITFPADFKVSNIQAFSNKQLTNSQLILDNEKIRIIIDLPNSKVGKNEKNELLINFIQEDLIKEFGNVWELMLPNIEDNDSDIKILASIPVLLDKKISISKPKPSLIKVNNNFTQILWVNPKTKIIYAVFGDRQYYKVNLVYNLKNSKPYPILTEIAFPPDTLYQKIYVENIAPKPIDFYSDEDGNFLGKIFLLPGEFKTINFSGIIEVLVNPRDTVRSILNHLFFKQKKYLLTAENKYWQINFSEEIKKIKKIEDIYQYTINTLDYDYKKIYKKTERIGAQKALENPKNAICTEFSDLFIALSKEKGFFAREIQGYGFSHEEYLRPISLNSDILHSWVEFYDVEKNIWIPVDPTWEETSGIDYFNSFDLNHIAFVIHGKKPDYPHPAGSYKVSDSKDILINAISTKPSEFKNLNIKIEKFPKIVYSNKKYQLEINLENKSNIYLWNVFLKIQGKNIEISPKEVFFAYLVPFEKKTINFEFKPNQVYSFSNGEISIIYLNEKIKKIFSIYPFYINYLNYIIVFLLILLAIFLILRNGIFNKKY